MTLNMRIREAKQILHTELSNSPSPREDADHLLMSLCNYSKAQLITQAEKSLTPAQQETLQNWLQRRQAGEPIAYIIGKRGFWTLDLQVTPATLIPRPETELLVETVLTKLELIQSARILDLGTGSGAIALALKAQRLQDDVTATDACQQALAVAQKNAQENKLAIKFVHGCWFKPLDPQCFDIIASNPPYVDANDPHLHSGDVRFEPQSALVAAQNGLADLAHIIHHALPYLNPNGWLLLEHGYQQGPATRTLLKQRGYHAITTLTDLLGHERITCGQIG